MARAGSQYRFGVQIASGGMADVFEGRVVGAEGFARPVAIKRMKLELSRDPLFGQMFVREARLASLLHHANIVSVLDFDRDPQGSLFLVMEYVSGIDLARLMRTGPVPIELAVHIVASMLRGLAHAHEFQYKGRFLGIVHCDVSPHNTMITWDGAVKIVDFGIARALARAHWSIPPGSDCPDGLASDLTSGLDSRAGASPLGKLNYMSPEQAHGVELDGRADLFSTGVVFYELLTGRRLFVGRDRVEVLAQLLRKKIAPPEIYRPGIPIGLVALCMRMLARDRRARPASARCTLDALVEVMAQSDLNTHADACGSAALGKFLRCRCPEQAPQVVANRAVFLSNRSVPLLPSQVMSSGKSEVDRMMGASTRTALPPAGCATIARDPHSALSPGMSHRRRRVALWISSAVLLVALAIATALAAG